MEFSILGCYYIIFSLSSMIYKCNACGALNELVNPIDSKQETEVMECGRIFNKEKELDTNVKIDVEIKEEPVEINDESASDWIVKGTSNLQDTMVST